MAQKMTQIMTQKMIQNDSQWLKKWSKMLKKNRFSCLWLAENLDINVRLAVKWFLFKFALFVVVAEGSMLLVDF